MDNIKKLDSQLTSKEIVLKAIHFDNPPRVPIFMYSKDFELTDIFMLPYNWRKDFHPKENGESEWGYTQHSLDATCGQVTNPPIATWDDFSNFKAPDPNLAERYEILTKFVKTHPDKFVMGNLGISGFSLYTFIRGFNNTMEDFYLEEDNMNKLLDIIFDYEYQVIQHMLDAGVDAIVFYDDWGTQRSLFVNIEMWKSFFKARYKRQFDLIHSRGKAVFFHSCGCVHSIIPELIEMGVEMVNFNGLEVLGIDNLHKYNGKLCFSCPVDLQSVVMSATRQEIFDYTYKMITQLGNEHGGYIAHLEDYSFMGMTAEQYWNCYDAWNKYKDYKVWKKWD